MSNKVYKNTTDLPSQYLFQPRLDSLIVYYDFASHEKSHSSNLSTRKENFKSAKTYSGDISKSGQKRLRKALEALYVSTKTRTVFNPVLGKYTKFKLSHLTLTLPAIQGKWTDKEIHKFCLAPFLLDCKRKLGLSQYIWKAERQSNGNLHYHIISDLFSEIGTIRKFWNDKLETLGFIDEFEKKHNHRNPPSIEITYVRSSESMNKYISKYISKAKSQKEKAKDSIQFSSVDLYDISKLGESTIVEFENRQKGLVSGRVWDCSTSLKSFKYQATSLSYKDEKAVNDIVNLLSKSRYDESYFSVVKFKNDNYIKHMPLQLRNTYIEQFSKILNENCEEFEVSRNLLNIKKTNQS